MKDSNPLRSPYKGGAQPVVRNQHGGKQSNRNPLLSEHTVFKTATSACSFYFPLAREQGLEPCTMVLETMVLPVKLFSYLVGVGGIKPTDCGFKAHRYITLLHPYLVVAQELNLQLPLIRWVLYHLTIPQYGRTYGS